MKIKYFLSLIIVFTSLQILSGCSNVEPVLVFSGGNESDSVVGPVTNTVPTNVLTSGSFVGESTTVQADGTKNKLRGRLTYGVGANSNNIVLESGSGKKIYGSLRVGM